MNLDSLQKKRADLMSQLEQHVGQINRINGAVAVLDDLILEVRQEEETRQAQQDAEDEAAEVWPIDRASATKEFLAFHDASMASVAGASSVPTHWGIHDGAAAAPDAPPLAPEAADALTRAHQAYKRREMLPIQPEDAPADALCANCLAPGYCTQHGCTK